ncbi:bile acid:sodium symporter [Neptunomonas sp. XY-337]|uniref:bile acid:sodium symporter n=1 Tax=Neptunomonas sp. XY-337 TaxID=2561897 RepID=UPI00145B77C2|nr:bile acid:sodium symporter [Neptunomonas sp. XY-337]
MKNLFLPAGLLVSFVVAWLFPALGNQLKELGLIPWTVVAIFVVNGYQTKLSELPKDKHFFSALAAAGIITLLLAPLLGSFVAHFLAFGSGMALGLIVKATVPSTLSTCIVMTQLAGGNALWALMITVILNVIGVFTIPMMLSLTLGGADGIALSPWDLLFKLILLVLLPFIGGLAAKRLLSLSPNHIVLQYLPSSCVIAAVWMSLSSSNDVFRSLEWGVLLKILIATFIVHFGLMALAWVASRLLKTPNEGVVALLLTSSQKTLPVAVSVLAALNQQVGEAILVCVLFHFIQLFADASLVPKMAKRWQQA